MNKGILVIFCDDSTTQRLRDHLLTADIGNMRLLEMVTIPHMNKTYTVWEGNEAGDRTHLVEAIQENFPQVTIDSCWQGIDLLASSRQTLEQLMQQ